jgi:Dyp-type peroxidase family
MAQEQKSQGLLRREFIKATGVGALTAGLGIDVVGAPGTETSPANLLDHTTIDPQEPTWHPLLDDLQGNILAGHGRDYSVYIFVTFGPESAAVKRWLRHFADTYVTSAKKQAGEAARYRQAGIPGDLFASAALAAAGYRALGFPPHTIPPDRSFLKGLRRRPDETWDGGYAHDLHALILLADDRQDQLNDAVATVRQELERVATFLHVEPGNRLRKYGQDVEPFGYVDNLSQPLFLKRDVEEARRHGTDLWNPAAPLGLALVRDPNALTAHGLGSYLVFQKLEQNVAGFKRRVRELAARLGIDVELAGALAVGRFRDGTPVTLQSTPGRPSDNFTYADDRYGTKCPFHAHARKTNPRGDTARLLAVGVPLAEERRRRIVRRSVAYGIQDVDAGPPLTVDPTTGVGLLFVCYQSDVSEQFEFIQSQWSDQLNFVRQQTGLDPLIGRGRQLAGGQLWHTTWGAQPHAEEAVPFDLSGFVHMKGGGYFFVPSLSFLKSL